MTLDKFKELLDKTVDNNVIPTEEECKKRLNVMLNRFGYTFVCTTINGMVYEGFLLNNN